MTFDVAKVASLGRRKEEVKSVKKTPDEYEVADSLENGFTRTSALNFCVRFCQLSNDGMTPPPPPTNMGTLQQLNF